MRLSHAIAIFFVMDMFVLPLLRNLGFSARSKKLKMHHVMFGLTIQTVLDLLILLLRTSKIRIPEFFPKNYFH